MTEDEYETLKARVRAAPDWKPHGDPNCTDCLGMSHCETHFKIEGSYPEDTAPGETKKRAGRMATPSEGVDK